MPEVADSRRAGGRHQHLGDAMIAICLGALAGLAAFHGQGRVDPLLLSPDGWDIWFDADLPHVYDNLINRGSDHVRTKDHPLFTLLTFPVVKAIQLLLGISPASAVRVLIAAVVAVNLGLVFVILRLVGCRRLNALAFSALAATTAASVFWSLVPETYQFGTLSILLALTVVAVDARRRIAPGWYFLVSALTLSFTITNWLAGLAATLSRFPWRHAVSISAAAFAAVTVLWGVQKHFFPTAAFFFGDPLRAQFFMPHESQPTHVLRAFFAHSVVMPAIGTLEVPWWIPQLSVQWSPILSTGWWGPLLVGGWWLLLGLGIWGLTATRWREGICFVLLTSIVSQFVLHLLFGRETFLYAAHFTPLLVIVSAFSVFTPLRSAPAGLAVVLAVGAGANNLDRLGEALDLVRDRLTQGNVTRAAMRARPADAWPRGTGHVLLGWPGSQEDRKAYHEPGGSFSPWVATFGVSVWVADQDGEAVATSDTIPINVIRQRFVTIGGTPVPAIVTETPFYRSAWSSPAPGRWILELSPYPPAATMLVVRSTGPAGGPITSLRWDDGRLTVNERWSLTVEPPPSAVHLGEEVDPGWKTADRRQTSVTSTTGWAFARLELHGTVRAVVTIDDPVNAESPGASRPTASHLRLRLPDENFLRSLEAQVTNLEMGLVGDETRPGDLSYPAPWPRDAAYSLVALARAGRLTDVNVLASCLAERDFFGGFGPEADAPGLALWALEETASLLGSPAYDDWLWPHARRKAELILAMLGTSRAFRRPAVEPIVPGFRSHPDLTLVAEPSSAALIMGRVDWQRPALYVNAISYRGLLDAARLAARRGERADAYRWRAAADELRTAWTRALESVRTRDHHHAFTNGLWPTGVAAAARDAYRRNLDRRFLARRDSNGRYRAPVRSTYFEAAEAHQWLFAGRPDRVWSTLQWLWDHQASPGLYTWWKDAGLDTADPFHRWEKVRGWVHPPHLTPDYWSAAEVLLLQLDMLAYAEDHPEPTIVIGAGVPRRWLEGPLNVRGVRTRLGEVDWVWDTRSLDVLVRGGHARVRLGSAFDSDVRVRIRFEER